MNAAIRLRFGWNPVVIGSAAVRLGCLLLLAASQLATAVQADDRPLNLIVIQTDEHHFGTLGCYGGTIVKTPHIDRIARSGELCSSFYATTPVCSPSRAALVSGLYPQKTAVVTNNIPMADSVVTFAAILGQRGYATGFAGKWHLDGNGKPQWAPKRKFGFADNRFMFNRGHWKKLVDGADGPRVGGRNKQGRASYDLNGADEKTFTTDWLTDKALEFIATNKDKPFCYMLSLPDPHGPNTVRAPYDTMYDDVVVPIPKTLVKGRGATPGWGQSAGVTAAQLKRIMPKYYGMVKCIDDNVGRILKSLDEQKLTSRTIIVFTSDHGDLCGEHGRLNKGVPYEGSARIPFLMACPGQVKPGTVIPEALSCVDFLPTVMKLMDVPVTHAIDGRDASALFAGQETPWNDLALLRSTSGRSPWLCAVTQKHKLVISAMDEPWLIDVQANPDETVNLFGREELKPTVRKLAAGLLGYAKQNNDSHARHPKIRESLMSAAQ